MQAGGSIKYQEYNIVLVRERIYGNGDRHSDAVRRRRV